MALCLRWQEPEIAVMPAVRLSLKSLLVAALAFGLLGATSPGPLLEASTEARTPGERRPDAAVIALVIKAVPDDLAGLDECLEDEGLGRGDYGSLLTEVRVAASPGVTLHFVRPAHQPYCWTLYGAHLFRYFLVAERTVDGKPAYQMVFENGGDAFRIYPAVSHGLNDIEDTNCTAVECWSARYAFDGTAYRPTQCHHMTFRPPEGREVTRRVRCDS